jgi:hypothetical protein
MPCPEDESVEILPKVLTGVTEAIEQLASILQRLADQKQIKPLLLEPMKSTI